MKDTNIQWSDTTINPVMGCDGCELWLRPEKIRNLIFKKYEENNIKIDKDHFGQHTKDWTTMNFVQNKKNLPLEKPSLGEIIINENCKCYAGTMHAKRSENKGYARNFDRPELHEGRIEKAAKWPELNGKARMDKPWLDGLPRVIFISDMGDALVEGMPFSVLTNQVIIPILKAGNRHMWLWLTKRPNKMVEFGEYLHRNNIYWPDNLMAMTTVTSNKSLGRVNDLRQVRCQLKGLSVEPLWEEIEINLTDIDWVIVGGESGVASKEFELNWARKLSVQCDEAKVAFFVKQLGKNPMDNGKPLDLANTHGGDWNEWPEDLRVRQMPNSFKLTGGDR